jgi:hypothetical protein
MFRRHVKKLLSAYAHGELAAPEAERVARHLSSCAACRRESDEITLGIRLAEQLPRAKAPDAIWDAIETSLVRARAKSTAADFPSVAPRRRLLPALAGRRLALASAALIVVVFGAAALFVYQRASATSWEVTSLQGSPLVGAKRIKKAGLLAIGAWLETDAASRAQIKVADIGQVEVDPGSRVRLVETRLTEHRLELERGRISARIWAPPRLFYVNTPSAVAEDLGCAYTLEVDDAGRSLLHVTHGWVAMVRDGRESLVPAGAACVTEPEEGPGTPFFEDATEAFVEALARFDFEKGGGDALRVVLAEARQRDTLTLWHLLPRVEGEARARVYERLINLSPPPVGVTREGVLALDQSALEAWKEEMEPIWVQENFPAVRRAWRKIWKFKQ